MILGARKTGKTTLAHLLASRFNYSLYFQAGDHVFRKLIRKSIPSIEQLQSLFFIKHKPFNPEQSLLIVDDLHVMPELIPSLAEWAVSAPGLSILCLSSQILENLQGATIRMLRPVSFREFIASTGEPETIESFHEVPFPVKSFHRLLELFHLYALIGGMPQIIKTYLSGKSMAALDKHYDDIHTSFEESVVEMTRSRRQEEMMKLTLMNAYPFAASRVKFSHFGNTPYGSREIREGFMRMEHHLLLHLSYPDTASHCESIPDIRRSPRLQMLDTGIVNCASGIQRQIRMASDLNQLFRGQIIHHIAGQEILASHPEPDYRLRFWNRPKLQATAEVDFLISYDGMMIPVVVRSGEPGRLRGLHQYLDEAPHPYAVRLYAGNVSIRKAETIRGKVYYLLNFPYFLAGKIQDHLKGFIAYINS